MRSSLNSTHNKVILEDSDEKVVFKNGHNAPGKDEEIWYVQRRLLTSPGDFPTPQLSRENPIPTNLRSLSQFARKCFPYFFIGVTLAAVDSLPLPESYLADYKGAAGC
ncbi:hypothetical protein J4Q44_G00198060 [Coregonus suidteri]|uniref:Uncharacterized protein n=1 Tax=Coregonus suidteri TaxID=861788 RepID=A0AAN8LPN2_9TELE